MQEPTTERLAELYIAWLEKRPPSFAGQYNEIIPMKDVRGQAIRTLAKVTWNPLREWYEMEPVEEVSPGVIADCFMDIPAVNHQQFLNAWAECGIAHFHRILVNGKLPEAAPTTLPASVFPKPVVLTGLVTIKFRP